MRRHRMLAAVPLRHLRRCSSLASPRVRARLEEEALRALDPIMEPLLTRCLQLVVQSDAHVAVKLEFSGGICPQRASIEQAIAAAIEALPWARSSSVSSSVARPSSFMGNAAPPSLRHVGALIGISSCKGGVGKSTVAANLAFALSTMGGRVGLLDADVHGPSLPTLVGLPDGSLPLKQDAHTKLVAPAKYGDVRLMSYGFIAKGASTGHVPAAVMRGPMVAKTVGQMLSGTDWGELDYLLVDLPPGTGDVLLTLSQTYGFTAAVVVTTPQRLSRADVIKGIDVLNELKVPIVAMVENMAYFRDDSGRDHYPFGTSQLDSVRQHARLQPADTFRVPIEAEMSHACDVGTPLVLVDSDIESKRVFFLAASHMAKVLASRQLAISKAANSSQLRYEPTRGLVLRFLSGPHEGGEFVLGNKKLLELRGAEPDGDALGVKTARLALHGIEECKTESNEAAALLRWRDGRETIVPFDTVVRLATSAEV